MARASGDVGRDAPATDGTNRDDACFRALADGSEPRTESAISSSEPRRASFVDVSECPGTVPVNESSRSFTNGFGEATAGSFRGVVAAAARRAASSSSPAAPAAPRFARATSRSWPSSGVVALGGVGGGLMAAASTVAAVAAGEFESTGSTRRNTSLTMTKSSTSRGGASASTAHPTPAASPSLEAIPDTASAELFVVDPPPRGTPRRKRSTKECMNVTSFPRRKPGPEEGPARELAELAVASRRESVPSTTARTFPPGIVWTSVETTRACLCLNSLCRRAMMPSVPLALGAVASSRRMGDSGPES